MEINNQLNKLNKKLQEYKKQAKYFEVAQRILQKLEISQNVCKLLKYFSKNNKFEDIIIASLKFLSLYSCNLESNQRDLIDIVPTLLELIPQDINAKVYKLLGVICSQIQDPNTYKDILKIGYTKINSLNVDNLKHIIQYQEAMAYIIFHSQDNYSNTLMKRTFLA